MPSRYTSPRSPDWDTSMLWADLNSDSDSDATYHPDESEGNQTESYNSDDDDGRNFHRWREQELLLTPNFKVPSLLHLQTGSRRRSARTPPHVISRPSTTQLQPHHTRLQPWLFGGFIFIITVALLWLVRTFTAAPQVFPGDHLPVLRLSVQQPPATLLPVIPLLENVTMFFTSAVMPLALPLYHFHWPLLPPPSRGALQPSQVYPHLLLEALESEIIDIEWLAKRVAKEESAKGEQVTYSRGMNAIEDMLRAGDCSKVAKSAVAHFKEIRGQLRFPTTALRRLALSLFSFLVNARGFHILSTDNPQWHDSPNHDRLLMAYAITEVLEEMYDHIEELRAGVEELENSIEMVRETKMQLQPWLEAVAASSAASWADDAPYHLCRLDRLDLHLSYLLRMVQWSGALLTKATADMASSLLYFKRLHPCFRLAYNDHCILHLGHIQDIILGLERLIEGIMADIHWKDAELLEFDKMDQKGRDTVLGEQELSPTTRQFDQLNIEWKRQDGRRILRRIFCLFLECG